MDPTFLFKTLMQDFESKRVCTFGGICFGPIRTRDEKVGKCTSTNILKCTAPLSTFTSWQPSFMSIYFGTKVAAFFGL